jgi:hypothetical protein
MFKKKGPEAFKEFYLCQYHITDFFRHSGLILFQTWES